MINRLILIKILNSSLLIKFGKKCLNSKKYIIKAKYVSDIS